MIQQRLFNESVQFVVRTGHGHIQYGESVRFSDTILTATRVPETHAGWRAVRYQNHWYELCGGIRTPLFICLNSPIRSATHRWRDAQYIRCLNQNGGTHG
jgi:lipocalin